MRMRTTTIALVSLLLCVHGLPGCSCGVTVGSPPLPPPPVGAPVLYFSDIESGPKTGWQDGTDHGAAVSLWGKNFGSVRGSSYVTVNGARLVTDADYPEWGSSGPAVGLERITFLVPAGAQDGLGQIAVTVNGTASNALPFTVRPGHLYLVSTSGDDTTGDGSFTHPWRSLYASGAVSYFGGSLVPGDIVYLGDGVAETAPATPGDSFAVGLGVNGEDGRPIALIGYPGATATVGNPMLQPFANWVVGSGPNQYWVLSNLDLVTASDISINTGWRVVGNRITAPLGTGQTGCIGGHGDRLRILGNEFYDVGAPDSTKLYHVIYLSSEGSGTGPRPPTESDREIGWNWFHDCLANRAVQTYSEGTYTAFTAGYRIHDNVIVNQKGDGIGIGGLVTGENWVYDNLVVHAGLGPSWVDDASGHEGLSFNAGADGGPVTTVHVYNNTVFECGWPPLSNQLWANGTLYVDPGMAARNATVELRNNVFVAAPGLSNVVSGSADLPPGDDTNLWWGDGQMPPSWDTTGVAMDPRFVGAPADLHLAAGSPAIDVGNAAVGSVVTRDLDAVPRPQGAGFDLGVYESLP